MSLLRKIPKVDLALESDELRVLVERYPRQHVVEGLRNVLAALRERGQSGDLKAEDLALNAIAAIVEKNLAERFRPSYRRVLNATGVVLHTNLGRAPLNAAVATRVGELASGAQRVEIDLETGARGARDAGCARLLCELTGAEAATVVNNNAAATLLILAALAKGKKVLLSRGEMVEIGGSYRIPDVMRESGAILVDVGTTNRTHERDYLEALDNAALDGTALDDTTSDNAVGMILKVHTSNYRVMGFTSEVEIERLAEIGREHGVPVVHDLGSGCLVDLAARGLPGEAAVSDSVRSGADLVCFSGDKLLGGPQAGIILGKREAVERCRRHSLFRAFRPGRLVYTALEETLRIYQRGEDEAVREIPALARLLANADDLRGVAQRLARRLRGLDGLDIQVVPCRSQAGSGSLPVRDYPSWAVQLIPRDRSLDRLATELRRGEPAIVGRTLDDALLLDVRTLEKDAFGLIAARLRELFPARP